MSKLGKLKKVKNLQDVWADEARDFTPWLAKEENLALIGETLGFGSDWLELLEMEANVGPFRADIICRDTAREDHIVVIENQFGSSDHDHLGKLLTYAAGRKAKTIIWIAEVIRDEHRAAIDLLNNATDDEYQFFALEIELWKIEDSPSAPRFNIIAKPNDWTRNIAKTAKRSNSTNLSQLKRTYVDYWTKFTDRLTGEANLSGRNPSPHRKMEMRIGRSGFTLTAQVNSQKKWIMAALELNGDDTDSFYQLLEAERSAIDSEAEFPLNWEELPNRKRARISVECSDTDPKDTNSWDQQHKWMVDKLNHLYQLFHHRIKELDLSDLDNIT